MHECVADASSPDVSVTGAVCRARRSCRYGCCGVEAGSAARWKETLPTLGEISPCVCLAVVPEDTGRSGRRALARARCAFTLHLSTPRLSPELSGRHRNLQATEDQAGAGGFQPTRHSGSSVLPPRCSGGLRSPERITVSQHRVWRGPLMNTRYARSKQTPVFDLSV